MSDLEKVKKLRKVTGAGFKDCNNALKEANGDIEKSIEILRVKGISKASKKMEREANEGIIASYGDSKKTSLIEINCETDFVAKNNDFIEFAKELSEINHNVDSDIKKLNKAEMKNKVSVEDNLVNLISKIGEKITIGRATTIHSKNSKNYIYMHTVIKDNLSKLAVISSLETENDNEKIDLFGKQLSMHIAASNPLALTEVDINQEVLDKEMKLISEELKNLGKPDDIAKKISLGKINKFKKDNSLLTQQWVMDPQKKVIDILESLNISDLKIKNFARFKIGE
tara:strand:- start:164 stop:1015 length:852 start_codon:yes stop_codon:yes gene_type:complete